MDDKSIGSPRQQANKFKSLLKEVGDELLRAQTHLHICEVFLSTEENVKLVKQYTGFFLPTWNAHRAQFFVKASNVVNRNRRSPSLHRLLKMICNNTNLTPGIDVQGLDNRLEQQTDILERIKQYRNKRAAHWETELSEPLSSIRLGEVRQLLKELQSIFNEIHKAHTGGTPWTFKIQAHQHTSYVLDRLRRKP